ncbi:hypothetical protein [Galactobacter valiniphilus]|uniref:hypothetical protein n=1 Tax=Galactobacter valiniphilus TaxID=2676122 RepID=UPI0037354D6B
MSAITALKKTTPPTVYHQVARTPRPLPTPDAGMAGALPDGAGSAGVPDGAGPRSALNIRAPAAGVRDGAEPSGASSVGSSLSPASGAGWGRAAGEAPVAPR